MQPFDFYYLKLNDHLTALATEEKAVAAKRYFPADERFIGINASDIRLIIKHFHQDNALLSAEQLLHVVEHLLTKAQYSEEVLITFGLLNGSVKKNFDVKLMARFKYWLENYETNWSHVDDLCIKNDLSIFVTKARIDSNNLQFVIISEQLVSTCKLCRLGQIYRA